MPSFASDTVLVAGVDIGGTKIAASVHDARDVGASLANERVATPRGRDEVLEAIIEVVERLAATVAGRGVLACVGVGAPGLVDREGVFRFGPNLPGLVEVPLAASLARRLGVPVLVENDATCATWAERQLGAAAGADDAVLVTLGTGIGAGVVAGGRLQRGAHGFAGEAGHMVVDQNGPPCPCGRRGCWERFASGTGLGRLARDAAMAGRADAVVAAAGGDPEDVRGEHVGIAARAGDLQALEIVRDFSWWVALGLANLANILDPELLLIGGGLVDAADLFLEPTREAFGELVYSAAHRGLPRIEPASLGSDAGVLGAALLGIEGRFPVPGG